MPTFGSSYDHSHEVDRHEHACHLRSRQTSHLGGLYWGSASTNLNIGLQHGTWGGQLENRFANVAPGDGLVLVHDIKVAEPKPKGNLRVGTPEEFRGTASRVIYANITEGSRHYEQSLWPDGAYPWRFRFEVLEEHTGVFIGVGSQPRELVDAIRSSAIATGSPKLNG